MIKKKIKIALIGCGRIGFLLESDPLRFKPCTHFGGALSAGMMINYACDINAERLRNFGKLAEIPGENLYDDYKQLITEVKPELVIISTWTGSHAEIGILAAQNNASVIICEKPIASNLAQAGVFLSECKKKSVELIVNHERRYDAGYRKVKEMLDSGRIGMVKTVHASLLTGGYRGKSAIGEGGGTLLHDGTHMIDIVRFLFGEIKTVRGEISRENRNTGFEDRAAAWLKTAGGIDIFLESGGSRRYFLFELSISGTDGKIVIGNGYQRLYTAAKSKYYTGFNDLRERPFPAVKGMNYFKREYVEAGNIINKKSDKISSSGLDGYRALEAVHAIYLSSHIKKEVELPVKPQMINLEEIFKL